MAKKTTIGDLVNFKRGYDLPHSQREDGEFPVVSSGGFSGSHKLQHPFQPNPNPTILLLRRILFLKIRRKAQMIRHRIPKRQRR
jgi:hypothetical protein